MEVPPDNLGSRQRALNARVNKAVANQVHFDSVKDEPDANDVDKLYKIDVAAKYKNVDYILEVLKSGDSLYTARALKKCPWLFDDKYSHVINPTYLQSNVFPFTSMKMKRKIIKAAAARVKHPKRAAEFFNYCMKEKMKGTAFTCLLYTTDDFKLDQLHNNKEPSFKTLEKKDRKYFRLFVGKSFPLLNALLEFMTSNVKETIRQFTYFFYETEEKYLDIVEKYLNEGYDYRLVLDPKISDRVMKKHKHRVFGKPKLYINILNTDVLRRNSSDDDIKMYVSSLLPGTVKEFWSKSYIYSRNFPECRVFEMIPREETFDFFKTYFNEHDPNSEFDTDLGFYEENYYQFFTNKQQEEWAFRQLQNGKHILGVGRDYLFYKFINFNTAFEEIKRLISVTKDPEIRSEMVNVLVHSAKNDQELERLLKYFKESHMNESVKFKDSFMCQVFFEKEVYEFDDDCWAAFYALIVDMDQYNSPNRYENSYSRQFTDKMCNSDAILYYILHEKEIDERLAIYLRDKFKAKHITLHFHKLTDDQIKKVRDYLFNYHINLIEESKYKKYGSKHFKNVIELNWERYLKNINKLLQYYGRAEEQPKICEKLNRRTNTEEEYNQHDYALNEKSLLRDLKKDKGLVIKKLLLNNCEFKTYPNKTSAFLKKIKIYFPDDVTKVYLNMFQNIFSPENMNVKKHKVANTIKTGVYVIFQLADEGAKMDFMKNYWPNPNSAFTTYDQESESEEDESVVYTKKKKYWMKKCKVRKETKEEPKLPPTLLEMNHRRIQKAISRHACLSRPPVSPSSLLGYMKTGCVRYFLHLSNMYLAVLPLPVCVSLVQSLIDSPRSIQKHAIRWAFQWFDTNSLIDVILKIWKSTKNVTVRSIIYKAIYDKVVQTKEKDLYDTLKILTLDLNQVDDEEVFKITMSKKDKIPDNFLGDHIGALWEAVDKLRDGEMNITRKQNVVNYMLFHLHLVSEEFVATIVNEHLNTMLDENQLQETYSKQTIAALYQKKWLLTAHYIVHFAGVRDSPDKYADLAQNIVRRTLHCWNEIAYDVHVYEKCCWDFITNLRKRSISENNGRTDNNTIHIFEGILSIVKTDLKYYNSELLSWELHLIILTKSILKNNSKTWKKEDKMEVINELMKEYGEGVGMLVLERVKNNMFFMTNSETVAKKIFGFAEELLKLIYKQANDTNSKWNEYLDKALITTAVFLMGLKSAETCVVAIQLLPTDCKEYKNNVAFKSFINALQQSPNAEVQVTLHQKFRKYLL